MATPNYAWPVPTVGSDQDTWGGILNSTIGESGGANTIDTDVKAVEDKADAAQATADGAVTDAAAAQTDADAAQGTADGAVTDAAAAQATADAALPKAGGDMTGRLNSHTSSVKATEQLTVSGAVAVDVSAGDYHVLDLSGNITALTFSNVPTISGQFLAIILEIKSNDKTIAWPSGIKWVGGAAPTLSASPGIDLIALTKNVDGGASDTDWRAGVVMEDVR